MRINALSRSYEQEFMKYGLPCRVYGGFKFFERKEIKDITAYLRILCNPLDNEALLRIINVPKRGIGAKTIETIVEYADRNGFSVFDGIYDVDNLDLPGGAKNKIREFKEIISKLIVDKETMGLSELVKSVIDRTDFMSCFSEDLKENDEKRANIDEFCNSAEEFERLNPSATLSEYLNSITLSSDTDEINDGNFITLATIHSVKGLEYNCVFICGLDKDIFPLERAHSDPAELEEERRLMYVAITRARERLFFTRAGSRYLYGSRRPTAQSEFLDELSQKLGIVKPRYSQYDRYYGKSGESYGYDSYSSYDDYSERRSASKSNGSYKNYDNYDNYGKTNYYNSKPGSGFNFGSGAAFSGAEEQRAENDVSQFKTGMKIKHKKFGEGTIIAIKDSGGHIIGDVAFKGVGIKSLVLKLAPIEIVD